MKRTLVRYTVKPGSEDENADLVRAVYKELADPRPNDFRYVTYRLDDDRTFIHIAEQDGGAESPLPKLAAFREFQADIAERCEWVPIVAGAETVGRFDSAKRAADPSD